MELIILIPGFISLLVVARWGLRVAFLSVYLPTMLLLPMYFVLRFPHLPPLMFTDTAILPIGLVLLAQGLPGWRLSWTDLAVCAMAVAAAIGEAANSIPENGGLQMFSAITNIVFPYIIGRQLIEPHGAERDIAPGTRILFLRRLVVLLALEAVISIYDFLSGKSTSQMVWSRFFPDQPIEWPQQVRWGFGRIEGAFAQAILAGMMFLCGLGYCLWLRRADATWLRRKVVGGLPWTGMGLVVAGIILGLLMTQSRGPWLGALMMLGIAWLARARSVKRAAMVLAGVVLAAGIVGYVFGSKYTEGSRLKAHDEEQENAIYRRELLNNYLPLVWQKPLTGWGITQYPSVGGQKSIDNQYLLLAVTEGLPGLALFLFVSGATACRLIRLLRGSINDLDRLLLFTHLGVLVGLWTTVASVYLGLQVQILFYLIVGWVQAMEPERLALAPGAKAPAQSRFGLANVLT